MNDFEYAKYLCKILLKSGEDCCSLCSYNKKDDICDNHKCTEKLNCPLDDDMCFMGMKRYAEKQTD